MLYVFDQIDQLDDTFPERCEPYLSRQRREKVFSYRFPLDRKLSAATYLLLRYALKERCGIDEAAEFSYNVYGKPFLCDYPRIHFNLSHCREAVACVLSDGDVGVDVQEITPVSDDLARRVLTAKEYTAFCASSDADQLFCDIWAVKESFLKKSGQGLNTDLTALSAEDIHDAKPFGAEGRYCGSVCGISIPFEHVRVAIPHGRNYYEPIVPGTI